MTTLQRLIYRAVLLLHPPAFRNEFAPEMALDFEDALHTRGFAPLLADALRSLARQWAILILPAREIDQPVSSHSFLSGQYCMVRLGGLNFLDVACASVLSVALLFAVAFAATIPNRHVIADSQTVRVSHDGGIDTGGNHASQAANGHREAAFTQDALPLSSHGAPFHGIVRLTRKPVAAGVGSRASGGPQPPSLAQALRQFAMVSIVVWITSFLFRRSPGLGRRIAVAAFGLFGIAASVAFASVPMPPIHAQLLHATTPLPSFEVATIRPWQPKQMPTAPVPVSVGAPDNRPVGPPRKIDPMGGGRAAGQRTDRVHIIGEVSILLQSAFNLPIGSGDQIVGAPGWVNSETDRYELQAKIDDSLFAAMQTMTPEQQRQQVELMEQSLLADRFKLKVHFETRELPAFALVVAKGGAKLTPAKEGESTQLSSGANETTGTAVTLDQFVHSPLLRPGGRIVLDQTGLKGAYDFTIKGETGPDPASFFTLIQEQLGLKLVPTKTPVEVIVIDHIERPSEN